MKISPVGAEMLDDDEQTDRHDEANSHHQYHHHPANTQLGNLFTSSGLSNPTVSTTVSLVSTATQSVAFYVGYSERKYRLRISLAHPPDCHFAHVQWLPL